MLDLTPDTQPMLRPSVRFAPVDAGIYVELGDRSFLIKGQKLRDIVVRLLRALNGRTSVGALQGQLPEPVRPLLSAILKSLNEHDMLIEGARGIARIDDADISIATFLQDVCEEWEERLSDLQSDLIVLWADPAKIATVVRCLLSVGAANLAVVDTGLDDDQRAALESLKEEADAPWTLIAPEASAAGATESSLLLYFGDDATLRTSRVLRDASSAHGATLPALLMPGCATVGPAFAGWQNWRALPADALPATAVFPVVAGQVAAALLAMEVVRYRANRDHSDSDGTRRDRVLVVHADGTVRRHDRDMLLASGRKLPERTVSSLPVVDGADDPWFDPDVGILEPTAADVPPFPLSHQGLRMHEAGSADHLLCAWGLSARDAFDRVTLLACELRAEQQLASMPGKEFVAVRKSMEDAIVAARSVAIAAQVTNQGTEARRSVDVAIECDADGQMLYRLARLYWRESPVLTIAEPDDEACIAWATIADVTAVGIGSSAAEATTEALGEAISAVQRGQGSDRQDRQPWRDLRRSDARNMAVPSDKVLTADIKITQKTDEPLPAGFFLAVAQV